jgi:Domain of unknown function (DUF4833)
MLMIEARKSTTYSSKEQLMKITGMTLLTLLLLPLLGWSKDLNLFFIQRSKNTNEVQYQLRVDDHCHISSTHPVSAFWQLREESPEKTKSLTELDQLAYGVVRQRVDENGVVFRLRALEQKPIKATATYDPHTGTCSPSAHVEINDQWVALERIYVQTEERRFRPKVTYIDLFGTSLVDSPIQVSERITP